MKPLTSLAALAVALGCSGAQAQYTNGTIRIGVLNDMSGTYADLSGRGSLIAARMAVEDFGAAAKGMKVEIVGADHQNKPDIGSNIVRKWIDTGKVDVIVDVPTSSVALAVNEIVRDKNKVFLVSGGATSDLTGAKCTLEHDPLDLRHLGAGQRHRAGNREDRRRHLVLPDRRLCLRSRA
jgi:branched-chain amino acid transport system substrate-binding protein